MASTFELLLAGVSCYKAVKHISLKASGLWWTRTEKKLTLAKQQTLLKAPAAFSLLIVAACLHSASPPSLCKVEWLA